MKVTNWRKKLAAAILAAGILIPSAARAVNIPVLDSDFNGFTVPGAGYAYANTYRPTSPWVDDLEHNSGNYIQDNSSSNWLYNTAYADDGPPYRGAPRGGAADQAMHGLFRYTAQELSTTFQANTVYTLSVWAQGDNNADNTPFPDSYANSVFLYIFDADGAPFTEAGSLKFKGFQGGTALGPGVDFLNRVGADNAASLANWKQLSISYAVPSGSPLVGKRIGIGFYIGEDAAIDDVSLSAVPEPASMLLVSMAGLTLCSYRRKR